MDKPFIGIAEAAADWIAANEPERNLQMLCEKGGEVLRLPMPIEWLPSITANQCLKAIVPIDYSFAEIPNNAALFADTPMAIRFGLRSFEVGSSLANAYTDEQIKALTQFLPRFILEGDLPTMFAVSHVLELLHVVRTTTPIVKAMN